MPHIEELSYNNSKAHLLKFQLLENSYGADWYGADDKASTYIWLLENVKNPLGFLSYKKLILPNKVDFIYVIKIYVLKKYRDKNPILLDEERVSEILFRQIETKSVNILTLESSCKKLDVHYESLGFEYNKDNSKIFAQAINTNSKVMHKTLGGLSHIEI